MKWYNFLIRNETNKYLLQYEKVSSSSLIICQETETRKFCKFKTYFDFYKYISTNVNINYHCFYEVIFGHLPQKIYFDIDIPILEEEITYLESKNILLELITCIKNEIPCILDSDIMIFNSHGPNKYSYHIVVDNWCFLDNKLNKLFYKIIMEKYPQKYHKFIDDSMYKSIQQFRIYNSHKWNTSRTKYLDVNSKWILDTSIYSDENLKELYILGSSLISNISNCKILPFYKEKIENIINYEILDVNIDKIINKCKTMMNFPFNFVKTENNLIILERMEKSYCKACDRIHDNIDPYLIVIDNTVYLNCRRCDINQYLFIIDDEYNKTEYNTPFTIDYNSDDESETECDEDENIILDIKIPNIEINNTKINNIEINNTKINNIEINNIEINNIEIDNNKINISTKISSNKKNIKFDKTDKEIYKHKCNDKSVSVTQTFMRTKSYF